MNVVDASRIEPEESAIILEKTKFVADNSTVMLMISSMTEARHIRPLLSCSTIKKIWNKLIQIHEQKTTSNKLILTHMFHQYKI